MSKIVLMDNEYITIECPPDKKLIAHVIHKPMGEEQIQLLKDALNAGTAALGEYRATKWLSDDRKNGPLPPEMVHWGNTDWNPRTMQAGWKYWAVVVPQEIAAAGTLRPVIEMLYDLGLRMRVFTNIEEATAWLDEME
jgi:hypothetical protein